MGWLFNRKKKETVLKKKECNHKWKDFPWYLKSTYYSGQSSYNIAIYEPYVCILCKERKDIPLGSISRTNETWEQCVEEVESVEEEYKDHLQPHPVVEDMIHDFQLIDRAYLEAFEKWQTMK